MCPHCEHELAAKDLIPVLSWLSLGGKCRYCKAPISAQYPVVELLTLGLFVLSYIVWPLELGSTLSYGVLALWLVALVHMIALAVYDLHWFLLPDKLVAPLTAVAAIFGIVRAFDSPGPVQGILTAAAGGLLLFAVFYGLFQISDGRWIGGGDVKIAAALGVLAGSPLQTLLLLFIASLLGTLVALPGLLAKGKVRGAQIPFGPYLIAATVITVFAGQTIVDWYSDLLLLS